MADNRKTGKSDAPADSASTSPPASQAGDPSITGPFKSLDSIKRKKVKKKGGKKRKLGLSCSKPGKKAWIRAYPDPEEFSMYARMLEVESGIDKEYFFIDPALDDDPDIGWLIERDSIEFMLHLYCTNRGRIALWPIKESENPWPDSARTALKIARDKWVRVIADLEDGRYEVEEDPDYDVEPKWDQLLGGKDMLNLMNLCFGKNFISSPDHPLFAELMSAEIVEED